MHEYTLSIPVYVVSSIYFQMTARAEASYSPEVRHTLCCSYPCFVLSSQCFAVTRVLKKCLG
jgi:hypothetical protein